MNVQLNLTKKLCFCYESTIAVKSANIIFISMPDNEIKISKECNAIPASSWMFPALAKLCCYQHIIADSQFIAIFVFFLIPFIILLFAVADKPMEEATAAKRAKLIVVFNFHYFTKVATFLLLCHCCHDCELIIALLKSLCLF